MFAANFFASQFEPITVPDSCFRFASREQSRQVENGLNGTSLPRAFTLSPIHHSTSLHQLGVLEHPTHRKNHTGFSRYVFSVIYNGLTLTVPMTRTNVRFPWLFEVPFNHSFSSSSLERTDVAAIEGLYNDGIATLAGSQS